MTAEDGCPGRGLIKMESPDQKEARALEFQTALCIKADDTALINAELAEEFKKFAEDWQGNTAVRIPQVPEDMSLEAFLEYPETKQALREGLVPIGYDLIEAQMISLELEEVFCYVLSGGMRTGKTSALRLFALMSSKIGADVCIIDTSGQCSQFATEHGMNCLVTADDICNWVEQTLVPEFKKRNENIAKAGGRKFCKQAQADEKQLLILIHDFSGFLTAIASEERDMSSTLEAIVKMGNGHKITLATVLTKDDSAAHLSNPIFAGIISWKSGLHLGGQVDNQRVLELEISYSEGSKKLPPGRGHTIVGSNTVSMVIPEA
jgi:S-DNA-T family DNA segregation ATPase FtsK/SpoIIIE